MGDAALPFLPHFSVRSTEMERLCCSRSNFFSFRVDLMFEGYVVQGSKQTVMQVVSLCKMVGKHGNLSIHCKENNLVMVLIGCIILEKKQRNYE